MTHVGPPFGYPSEPPRPPRRRRSSGWLLALVVLFALAFVATGGLSRGIAAIQSLAGSAASAAGESTGLLTPGAGQPLRGPRLEDVSREVVRSLVNVNTRLGFQGAEGAGTGIVLNSSGDVLTNNHVINGATQIQVRSLATGGSYPATVVGYDRTHDIAVLRIQGAPDLRPATLGDSDSVAIGDQIAAIGNAGGSGQPTVASGTVSALNRSITTTDELSGSSERLSGLIEVAAKVEAGESGGPLINSNGQVVGVTTAASVNFRYQTPGGTGYAIPINAAAAIARQISAGTASDTVHVGPTGMLGVTVVSAVDRSSPYRRDLDERATGSGATVAGVASGSPAAELGLARGDVIVSVDGRDVRSATDLVALVGRHHPGDRIPIRWVDRLGEQHDDTATLVPGPPA
ncbi:S1C family serine protease [Pseudonocardia acaciae]|uniref:S1C family serine protease n=1 Tax=Pseudonocardia acaciae TaxID=551276 RepID=UPI0014702BF2|nr:trypsin-like peptidase domain-containing protein [Pseudonocardia acaciae]